MKHFSLFFLLCVFLIGCRTTQRATEQPLGLPLLYVEDFEAGDWSDFEPTDPLAWQIETVDGNRVLSQFKRQSDYEPPVWSPFNRAILKDVIVGDFVLQARVRSTIEDYNHRDVCVFYGFQDSTHYYYTHYGKEADDQAHTIMIVNDAPRTPIQQERTDGTPWTDDWHTIRVVRRVDLGTIEVYFDDLDTPIMRAVDTTFTWGQVGFGTFDDTAQFDDIRLWGRRVSPSQ